MDTFVLKRVAAELDAFLRGALVSRVHQPAEREVVLVLWTGREERRLLLSADPLMCRMHLVVRGTPNPPSPPRFCQFLRRHLEGMRIEGIACAPFDRRVRIDFTASRPDALHRRTTLHAELFGRHANLVYVDDDGTILEPLRPVGPHESRIRELAPGLPYRPLPRPERTFLPDLTPEDATRLFARAGEGLDRVLLAELSGIGPDVAREAAGRGGASAEALYAVVRDLVRRYEEDDLAPGLGILPGGAKRLLPFPCPAAGFVHFLPFPTANDAAAAYYAEAAGTRTRQALAQALRSRIAALLRKERATLAKIEGDETRLREALKGREAGETLKAHLHELRRGMTEFMGIPLDPARTPVENMERLFRLHKKAAGAMEIVGARKGTVAERIRRLESLDDRLGQARTLEELAPLREELSAAFPGPGRGRRSEERQAQPRRGPSARVEQHRFLGHTILVGKNDAGNDRIVRDLAAPDDLWLHAQGIPGGHVLVKKLPGQAVPEEVVQEAARLAVLHSKARGSSNVPVVLALARHVSRFRGAGPGLVRIARYRTIVVR